MKTFTPNAQKVARKWHLLDAKGQILGRLSTQAASLLIGKHKPDFSANLDLGDYVVVINAEKIEVTGNKLLQKMYYRHSPYPGGLKAQSLRDKLKQDADKVIEIAVKGMLPKNKLQSGRLQRLKVFVGDQHPYAVNLGQEASAKMESQPETTAK